MQGDKFATLTCKAAAHNCNIFFKAVRWAYPLTALTDALRVNTQHKANSDNCVLLLRHTWAQAQQSFESTLLEKQVFRRQRHYHSRSKVILLARHRYFSAVTCRSAACARLQVNPAILCF